MRDSEVIIIDNLLTCTIAPGENAADVQQWAMVQPWLIKLREQGRTVIILHHTNAGGEKQMGTSTRETILNTMIGLRVGTICDNSEKTEIEWRFTKTRDFAGKASEPLHLQYYRDHDGKDVWEHRSLMDVKLAKYKQLKRLGNAKMAKDYLNLSTQEVAQFEAKITGIS